MLRTARREKDSLRLFPRMLGRCVDGGGDLKRIAFSAMVLWFVGCATARESRIDALMKDYDSAAAPGASVVVVRNGEVVFRKSYGMANLEESIPVEPLTNFRLASVTKQFTAAAILLLAQRDKLSLEDPIATFLPALPKTITIRHLLTHTSGLIDYEDVMPEGTTEQLKDVDVLRVIEGRELYFAPGASYRYSNTGYALLALIVERASGVSFATFLRASVFVPRGMKSSVAHEEGISTVSNRAYGYSRDGDGWRRTDQSRTSAVLGDGGIYASVDDLVAWLRSLESDRLFDEAMSPLVATDKAKVRYGFGWRVGEGRVWHTGETIGFRNALVRFRSERVGVVVLTNRNEGSPYEKALTIARAFGVGAD